MMSSEEIKTEIDYIASKVNQFILNNLCGEPSNLYDASLHYIKSGGKRLRPFMTIKSCQLLGGEVETSIPAACSVELIHNFTLVHDDIMDNDNMRHNVPTVHNHFGTPLAILSGDILFSKAFHILTVFARKVGIKDYAIVEMVKLLSHACVEVCEGQAMDIKMAENNDFSSEEVYLKMIEKKTSTLFKLSCELGVLSSPGYTEKSLRDMSNYGTKIGVAFQLIDDLIGIYGDSTITGKQVGNDIREGKKTLPILLAFQKLDPSDRKKLKSYFGKKNITESEIQEIIKKIAKINIHNDVRELANQYVNEAFKIIDVYDDSPILISLKNSANYVVQRSL